METETHLQMLGHEAEDKVTGYKGIVTSISFDLYGCVQAIVTPPMDDKGEVGSGKWFDVTRLRILSTVPVMELPDFSKGYIAQGKKGCAEKPMP